MHPFVSGNGPLDARLVIIGERPGPEEMRELAPMIGPTGAAVYSALGVSRATLDERKMGAMRAWQDRLLSGLGVRITNVRCTLDEMVGRIDCAEHFQLEMDSLRDARTLLCVGADATMKVLGRADVMHLHNTVWTRAEADAMRQVTGGLLRLPPQVHTVVCSLHPSYAMHGNPQAWGMIYQAIQRARKWSNRDEGPSRKMRFLLDPTPEELREVLRGGAGCIGGHNFAYDQLAFLANGCELQTRPNGPFWLVDIETPGEGQETVIELVGVSTEPDFAVVFPWISPYIEIFREATRGPEQRLVNTIDAGALIWPPTSRKVVKTGKEQKMPWLSLAMCVARVREDAPYWKDCDDSRTRAFYRTAFPDVPDYQHRRLYCALDCIYNRQLWAEQVPALRQLGVWPLYTNVVAPAGPVFVRMEARGVKIDAAKRAELLKQTESRIAGLEADVIAQASDFHAKRRAMLEQQIESLEALRDHELATHPLFTAAPGDSEADPEIVGLQPCGDHPEFRGLTRRAKCDGCAAVYRGAASLRAKLGEMRKSASKVRDRLKRLGAAFKPGSKDHWITLLFDPEIGLGLKPIAYTEVRKEPKLDDETVEELGKLYPECEILSSRVELQHLFHRRDVTLAVEVDEEGRAHAAFSQHRASTGRSSSGSDKDEADKQRRSDAGNLQNWTDADRVLVVPGGRDGLIAEADFSQIELRGMAWSARELNLLNDLRNGIDIHAQNAERMFGIPAAQTRDVELMIQGMMQPARQGGKKVTHMVDYGARAEKVGATIRPWQGREIDEVVDFLRRPENREVVFKALRLRNYARILPAIGRVAGVPGERHRLYAAANTATAAAWIEAYFKPYPRMRAYQDELVQQASRDGYVMNAWGRRFYIHDWRYGEQGRRPADANDVIAFPGQSNAGEIAKAVLPDMERVFGELCGGQLCIFGHDSYDGEIPTGAVAAFQGFSRPVLEREWPEMGEIPGFGLFKCPAEFLFGLNWGKQHICKPKKCKHTPEAPCDRWNPEGLHEWTPNEAPVLRSATGAGSRN